LALDADAARQLAGQAYEQVVRLSEGIGPRGSCRPGEQQAAAYTAEKFRDLGLVDVQVQPFNGSPTAYGRYTVVFAAALLAQGFAALVATGWAYSLAGLVLAAAGYGFFAESDFRGNWTRWIIASRSSQNVLARTCAGGVRERRAVIAAHLDSHRTPFFNSTPAWQRVYNLGFKISFIALILGAMLGVLAGAMNGVGWRVAFHLTAIPFLCGLLAFLHADRTPFSPGAYDNASGVACVLALAGHLARHPLPRTEVWFVGTGCEETGAGGMRALVEARGQDWREALWINLDQTGIGDSYLRLEEGMLRRYRCKSEALQMARMAAAASAVTLRERVSQAFSDAIIAHREGVLALSFGASPAGGAPTPRHQLQDLPDRIEEATLGNTIRLVTSLLEIWDSQQP
jgi:hypothetical protein